MPAKNKGEKLARSHERRLQRKNRVPISLEGTPNGKHLGGFKGMKIDVECNCGGCNPAAKENRKKAKYL